MLDQWQRVAAYLHAVALLYQCLDVCVAVQVLVMGEFVVDVFKFRVCDVAAILCARMNDDDLAFDLIALRFHKGFMFRLEFMYELGKLAREPRHYSKGDAAYKSCKDSEEQLPPPLISYEQPFYVTT